MDRGGRIEKSPAEHSIEVTRWPRNVEAEAAFLGACFISNEIVDVHSGVLRPEHFASPLHSRMWATMLQMSAKARSFTPVTLKPIFEDDADMIAAGGPAYMMGMTSDGAGLIGHNDIADQIIELARRRQLIMAMGESVEQICRPGEWIETEEVVSVLEAKLWGGSEEQKKKPLGAGAAVRLVADRQTEIHNRGFVEGATPMTITDFTKITGPLPGGEITYIAARTSVGKTAVAMSLAWGFAANGHVTRYLHNEMTPEAVSMRFVADLSYGMGQPIKLTDLRLGKLTEQGMMWLEKVEERAASLPITFHDIADRDIDYIRGLVRREVSRLALDGRKLQVLVIDYMQKIKARDRDGREIENNKARVDKVSAFLLQIAKEFDLHVIALSQLGRQVDERPDRKPRLSDLKESGDLEQDADNVILLWRPEIHLAENEPPKGNPGSKEERAYEEWYIDMETWRGKMELIGAKVRNGSKRSRRVRFSGEHSAVRSATFDAEAGLTMPDLFAAGEPDDSLNFGNTGGVL